MPEPMTPTPTPAQLAKARAIAERSGYWHGVPGWKTHVADAIAAALADEAQQALQAGLREAAAVECTCRVIEKCDRCEAIDAALAEEGPSR